MRKEIMFSLMILCITSGFATAQPVEVEPTQQKVLKNESGRYVFGQISDFRKDQYLLDTKTGRLWRIVIDQENHTKLQPVPFIQILGTEAYIPDQDQEAISHQSFVNTNFLRNLQNAEKEKGGASSKANGN